jgi:hypothetical protein
MLADARENIPARRIRSEKDSVVVPAKPQNVARKMSENALKFQRKVDAFFDTHHVSEVMCGEEKCSMKIDNKLVNGYSQLSPDSEIFVAETDGERIVFSDSMGNRYAKSIASLLGE